MWITSLRMASVPVCAMLFTAATLAGQSARSATIVLGGGVLVTVNPDSGSISVVDPSSLTKKHEIAVCATPQSLALDGGSAAYVVCRDGALYEVDLVRGTTVRSVNVGHDPFGVVVAGERILVSVTGEARLVALERASLHPVASVRTEPFPRGIAVQDGTVYVTHFRSGRLSVIDLGSLAVTNVIATVSDAHLSQSVLVVGNRAYLPQTRSNAGNTALLFDSTVFPIVSVVDLVARHELPGERLSIDIIDRPSAIPIDAAMTADGRLLVVHAGSDDVSVIDVVRRRLVAHIDTGSNPRGIVLSADERFAFVNDTLSGSVSVIDLTANRLAGTIPVTQIPLSPSLRNGKILFNTSRHTGIAKDRWVACASCHFDGGTDGRTWFFRDGPRNTTSLFGVAETLPSHWSGDLDELQDVEDTIRVVQGGTGLASGASNCTPRCDAGAPNAGRSQDLDDLAAFLRSLQPPPPRAKSEAAIRGERLFSDARTRCASCHPPPRFTDTKSHDVGTGGGPFERRGPRFDTPSLRGLSDTAPYFHDGRAASLLDVVRSADGAHGDTTFLTESEELDLAAFLESIPFSDRPRKRRAARP